MKRETIVKFGIALTFVVIVAGCTSGSENVSDVDVSSQQVQYATQFSEGSISVELSPEDYHNGLLTVAFSLNTHTVDMSDINLQEQLQLEMDGQTYSPLNKPALSGHHNSGTVEFALPEAPEIFKITVNGIPDVPERIFEWR